MNVLDRHHSVVVDLVVAEARNVWSGAAEAGQDQRLRRVGEEELHCEKVALTHSPVQVRIELVFLEDRRHGTGIAPLGLWSGDCKVETLLGEAFARFGKHEVAVADLSCQAGLNSAEF